MRRFYVGNKITGEKILVDDINMLHHLRDVLRVKPGEHVVLFDGSGKEYVAEITGISKNCIECRVVNLCRSEEAKSRLVVACALPKLGRMDDIVDMLTQLGVDVIIPIVTERTIVRPNDTAKEARLRRWRRIAVQAAAQSKRSFVPEVSTISSFSDVIERSSCYSMRLIATLYEESVLLRDVINRSRTFQDLLVMVGPEGDFTPREVETAVKAGFVPVSLGKNVLRVATATLALVAYIKLSGVMDS